MGVMRKIIALSYAFKTIPDGYQTKRSCRRKRLFIDTQQCNRYTVLPQQTTAIHRQDMSLSRRTGFRPDNTVYCAQHTSWPTIQTWRINMNQNIRLETPCRGTGLLNVQFNEYPKTFGCLSGNLAGYGRHKRSTSWCTRSYIKIVDPP